MRLTIPAGLDSAAGSFVQLTATKTMSARAFLGAGLDRGAKFAHQL
jgi:hypothetical protein